MSRDELMVAQLREVFTTTPVDKCLDHDDGERFYILEDDTLSKSIIEEYLILNDGFLIINPNKKTVYLLAVDNCFLEYLDEYEGKRCDCIVFDDHYFCFVELKLNVSEPRQVTKRLREARKQLGNVIEFFRETFDKASRDFFGFEMEAYVVMRQNVYPKSRASRVSVFVEFLDKYGVKLLEKDFKEL